MIRFVLRAATIAILAATPALAETEADATPPVLSAPAIAYTSWTLDNGLTVIALPDETTGTVTTSLWYAIGSKYDPQGRAGFAHLFEHILSRKTQNMPYNMILELTADVGGTRNASNWVDRTNYWEQVPAAYLETMLWTHRERMANGVLDQDVFETERGVVKEELRQRVLATPYGRLQRLVIPENAYDIMPHRRPGIGSIADLDAASLEDAHAFYEAYYGPDSATLIVAGNFEMGALRELVDRYFADIPRRANPVALTILEREAAPDAPRSIAATAPNVPLPVVGGIWKAPPVTHPDAAALEVLEAVLARGANSRLHAALVRGGQAVQVAANVSLFREAGQIAVYALVRDESRLAAAGMALDAELLTLRSELISAEELTEAQSEIFAESLRRRETARGRAFELGEALMASGDPGFADARLAAIAGVSEEDVRRVAAHYLAPQKRVSMTYTQGPDDPASYANPMAMPEFRSLPPATGELRTVKPEGERAAPPGPAAAPEIAAPTMVEGRLTNGIRVVAAQTGNVPLATITMLVPGGSRTDSREKAGVAQLAAALAAKGVHGMDESAIAARFERLGASFTGDSDSDGTVFTLTAPTANLEQAGALAAAIVKGAIYPDDAFERERARALAGLRVSSSAPGDLSRMAMRTAMYGDAAYGIQGEGTDTSLAAITRSDLLEYRQRYIHPDRMQMVISGGIAPQAALSLAQAMLGDWKTDLLPWPLPTDAAGPVQAPRTIVIDLPGADQASVAAGLRAPSRWSPDFMALELANSVLGGGSGGRLFKEVRTKRSLSYGAYSDLPERSDAAILTARAQTRNETAGEVAQIFLDEFARLASEPLDAELLDKRRLYLGGIRARAMETSGGFNAVVAQLLLHGLPPQEAVRYAEQLKAVDPGAASAAARGLADPAAATIVIAGDAALFLDDLRALRGDVEVIPASQLDFGVVSLRKVTATDAVAAE